MIQNLPLMRRVSRVYAHEKDIARLRVIIDFFRGFDEHQYIVDICRSITDTYDRKEHAN